MGDGWERAGSGEREVWEVWEMWEMWEMWIKWVNGERKGGLWSPAVTVWKAVSGLMGWWSSVGECRVPGAGCTVPK